VVRIGFINQDAFFADINEKLIKSVHLLAFGSQM
jgi:hypothetical protein